MKKGGWKAKFISYFTYFAKTLLPPYWSIISHSLQFTCSTRLGVPACIIYRPRWEWQQQQKYQQPPQKKEPNKGSQFRRWFECDASKRKIPKCLPKKSTIHLFGTHACYRFLLPSFCLFWIFFLPFRNTLESHAYHDITIFHFTNVVRIQKIKKKEK